MVALTFDDGPHPIVTPRILNLLKQYNARATFFVLGNRVDSYADVLQREYTEGHEIGNHSYNHASLSKLDAQEIAFQVQETDERISHLLPTAPVLFGPLMGRSMMQQERPYKSRLSSGRSIRRTGRTAAAAPLPARFWKR